MYRPRRGAFGVGWIVCFWALITLCSTATATECDHYTSEASRVVLKLPIVSRISIDAAYFAHSPPTLSQASPNSRGLRALKPEQLTVSGNLLEAIFCSFNILPGMPTVVTFGPKSIVLNANQVLLQGTDTSGRKLIEMLSGDAVTIDWPTIKDGYFYWRKDNDGLNIELQFRGVVPRDIRPGKVTVLIERMGTVCRAPTGKYGRDPSSGRMVQVLVSVNGGPNLLKEAKHYDDIPCGPSEALVFELPDTEVTAANGKLLFTVAFKKTATASVSSVTALSQAAALLAPPRNEFRGSLRARLNFEGGNVYPQETVLRLR